MSESIADRIMIVCEGDTEQLYLGELAAFMGIGEKLFICHGNAQDPGDALEKIAKERRWAEVSGQPYPQEIWFVFDRDSHSRYRQAVALATKAEIRTAFSRPCIEYWFLLHFPTARINMAKNAKLVYEHTTEKVESPDGIVEESIVTRYEPITPPQRCLDELFCFVPGYSKAKNAFLPIFGKHTELAYTRAKKCDQSPYSHGSDLPKLIDRMCEIAGITPSALFDRLRTVKGSFPQASCRLLPPINKVESICAILGRDRPFVTEEEWQTVKAHATKLASWIRLTVEKRNHFNPDERKRVAQSMRLQGGYVGEADPIAEGETLATLVRKHGNDLTKMDEAALRDMVQILQKIYFAANFELRTTGSK